MRAKSSTTIPADAALPAASGYRMPAEWEPHDATWLTWPCNLWEWGTLLNGAREVFAQIAAGLCDSETVCIIVPDAVNETGVREYLNARNVPLENIRIHIMPCKYSWARDHGPIFIKRDQEVDPLAVVDWGFNAWGDKYPDWRDDDEIPRKVAAILGLPCHIPPLILEGGSIDVNGTGTMLTTEAVLLNPNRNPGVSKQEIERLIKGYLGVSNILWLGAGLAGDDTDGHIDDIARFVNQRTVVVANPGNAGSLNHMPLSENIERLCAMRLEDGSVPEVIELPPAPVIFRKTDLPGRPAGEPLPASYANFYIGNGAILLPVFGSDQDIRAMGMMRDLFPGRKIVPIRCDDLIGGCGALHCVTQQQPSAPANPITPIKA